MVMVPRRISVLDFRDSSDRIILHLIFDHADLNVKIDELGKLTGYKYFPSKHVWQRDSEPTASEPTGYNNLQLS